MYAVTTVLNFQIFSGVTAGHPQKRLEGSGEGDTSCSQLEVLRGRDGRDGRDGEKGIPGERGEKGDKGVVGLTGPRGPQGQEGQKGESRDRGVPGLPGPTGPRVECGQTYVRWGRTTCPERQATELVYSGRVGGSHYNNAGGATNYLCMPDNPDYLQYDSGMQGENYVYGVEYNLPAGEPLSVNHDRNVPCAVCMTVSRFSLLMIPGKTSCPVSWTREYYGYLMSAHQTYTLPTTYEWSTKTQSLFQD